MRFGDYNCSIGKSLRLKFSQFNNFPKSSALLIKTNIYLNTILPWFSFNQCDKILNL